jgi:membrane protein implicated in regulation of membrane protease activity
VIYLAFAVWMGIAGGVVGKLKGSSFLLWWLVSTLLPVLGLVAALLYRSERDELRRQCPGCGKVVKLHDALCMRCGTELEFPEVAIVPESAAPARR